MDYNNIFKLYLFILEMPIKPVVDTFFCVFRVRKRVKLYTYQGKEVYFSGETCVDIGLKKCTFQVRKTPERYTKYSDAEYFLTQERI